MPQISPENLTPLSMALYHGMHLKLEMAKVAADAVAELWHVPLLVVHIGVLYGNDVWGLIDATTDEGRRVAHNAVYRTAQSVSNDAQGGTARSG